MQVAVDSVDGTAVQGYGAGRIGATPLPIPHHGGAVDDEESISDVRASTAARDTLPSTTVMR